VLTGEITSEKGLLPLKFTSKKKYTVEIQFIGYKTVSKTVVLSVDQKSTNLNTIILEEDAIQLKVSKL
jgi:hypothetical protein